MRPAALDERDAQIVAAYAAGARVDDLARTHRLSSARVYQVLGRSAARRTGREQSLADRQERTADERAFHLLTWSANHVGDPWTACGLPGLTAAEARSILGDRFSLHPAHQGNATAVPAGPRSRYSDACLADMARNYLDTPGPWSLAGFEAWLAPQADAPSVTLVRRRLGGWPGILRATRCGTRVSGAADTVLPCTST